MAYTDLRDFIAALERAGELKRIKVEVDPLLEITEITDRVSKAGKPGNPTPGNLSKMKPGGPARKQQSHSPELPLVAMNAISALWTSCCISGVRNSVI